MDLSKIKSDIIPFIELAGLKLFSIEYKNEKEIGNVLEIIVDKDGFVDIDDVTKVTELVNEYLDREDPIDEEYSLEISSRGVEKEFTFDEAAHYIGEYILVKTFEQEFYGSLENVDGATLTIKNQKNKKININANDISLLRIAIKF